MILKAPMVLISQSTWADLEKVREDIGALQQAGTVQSAAQSFASLYAKAFSSTVLARIFLVQPFSALQEAEQAVARRFVANDSRLGPQTRVLSLLGTCGREKDWTDRARSKDHLAIPLLDRSFVQGAPMIAKLLSELNVDLAALDSGLPIATRQMLGGTSGMFYVHDAQTAVDEIGRKIIPAQDFVDRHAVRTVFGMGGAYSDGTLVVAVVFTAELLDRLLVDRFGTLIINFKIATAQNQSLGRVY